MGVCFFAGFRLCNDRINMNNDSERETRFRTTALYTGRIAMGLKGGMSRPNFLLMGRSLISMYGDEGVGSSVKQDL